MITVTRKIAMQLLLAASKSGRILHFYGPPGVSKTALGADFAAATKRAFLPRRLSQLPQEEVGGVPTSQDASSNYVKRKALEMFREAIEGPAVLLLDEWVNAPTSTRGAALQLLDERRVGDVALHPDTVIMLCSNLEQQSAGGVLESLPERNRAIRVNLALSHEDWITWIRDQATARDATDPLWSEYARDIAATVDARPNLLQLDPPHGLESTNETWATPRAWHIAIDVLAGLGADASQDAINAVICGAVGEDMGGAYMALRKMRAQLPTPAQIVADPNGATLPKAMDAGVAALAIVDTAARKSACAAWVYAARLIKSPGCEEILLAMERVLSSYGLEPDKSSPHYAAANQARVSMLGKKNSFANGK